MNHGVSVYLFFESDSEKFCFIVYLKKLLVVFVFSLVLYSAISHGVQRKLGIYQGGSLFAFVEARIHFQYSQVDHTLYLTIK